MSSPYLVTFPIPQPLAARCSKLAGFALAATQSGALRDFVYLRDLVPELDGDSGGDGNWGTAVDAMRDPRCADVIAALRALGAVSAGVIAPFEFLELKRLADEPSTTHA
jgi:hypothetical protein